MGAADSFTPQCQEGQVISRAISLSAEFELLESSVIQDGEELPPDAHPEITRTTAISSQLDCVETITAAADGRATAFSREYEGAAGSVQFDMEMSGEHAMDPISESHDFDSSVEGETVIVKLEGGDDSDKPEWTVKPAEGADLSEDDAAELRADYSFSFLLPGEEMGKGDTWTVDVAHLPDLMEPIGQLPSEEDEDAEFEGPEDEGEPEISGTITATHAGTREVDGAELIVVKLEFECESEHVMEPDTEGMEAGEGVTLSSLEINTGEVVEGEGEYLFDPATGLISKIEIELSVERTKTEMVTLEVEGMGQVEIEQSEVEGGNVVVSVESSIA